MGSFIQPTQHNTFFSLDVLRKGSKKHSWMGREPQKLTSEARQALLGGRLTNCALCISEGHWVHCLQCVYEESAVTC